MARLAVLFLLVVVFLQFAAIVGLYKTYEKFERSNDNMFNGLVNCMETCQQRICK